MAMPPIPRVKHGRAAVFALLALAAVALQASLHEPTGSGSVANAGLADGPAGGMQAGPLEVELAREALQIKPVASPTARIRYDIPGWGLHTTAPYDGPRRRRTSRRLRPQGNSLLLRCKGPNVPRRRPGRAPPNTS